MPSQSYDTLIIGGGAAGLAAADVLSAHGKSTLILEARDRIGGRIDTRHDPAWPIPIERGPEFIHGRPKETWNILHAAPDQLTAYDIPGNFHVYHQGKLRQDPRFWQELEQALSLTRRVKTTDLTFDDTLRKFGKHLSPDIVARARMFVSGFDAADPATVSAQWLEAQGIASDKIEGDRAFRLKTGYQSLLRFLLSGLKNSKLLLSTVAHTVRWNNRSVSLLAADKNNVTTTYTARSLLITVPISILQLPPHEQGALTFDPPLPAWKTKAIHLLRMGPILKLILRFRSPFWEEKFPDLGFFTAPTHAIPTWWTTAPLRTSILTGWCGGPNALALTGKRTDELLTIATRDLAKTLRIPQKKIQQQFVEAHICDWLSDPFARGAYSYAAVGGATAAEALAKPIDKTLFFAGEATYSGLTGTVAAALASGQAAAKAILAR